MSARHVTETTVLRTYSLQVIGPDRWPGPVSVGNLAKVIAEAEENMSDLLPEKYRVVIREWDEEETPNERS